jgi:hypothetical protein
MAPSFSLSASGAGTCCEIETRGGGRSGELF